MKNEFVITDFGEPIKEPCQSTSFVENNNCTVEVFQYGAWLVEDNTLIEVIEASNDLEYLKEKYKAELVKVYEVPEKGEE